MTFQVCRCSKMMPLVDMVFENRNTATIDRHIAPPYKTICAALRREPSSGYVEPDAQPLSTTPYTPSDEQAKTTRTPTGRSVSCSAVWCPNIDTCGPNGIT